MSLATGMYLGLAGLATMAFLRPWPVTLLGTATAVVSNYLVAERMLEPSKTYSTPWIVITAGTTMLCARSLVPTGPWEVVPYALGYLTVVTLPYLIYRARRRPTAHPTSVVTEQVVSTEVPLPQMHIVVHPPVDNTPTPETRVTIAPADEDYDHLEDAALLP
jgi:hypothetical protein